MRFVIFVNLSGESDYSFNSISMKFTKTFLSLAVATALLASCKKEVAADAASAGKTVAAVGKTETATFKIEGMSCAVMCAGKIQKELSAMKGVQKAEVDFDKKTATVAYDSAVVTPQQLAEKVESVAGGDLYKVSELKSTADRAMLGDPVKEKGKKKKKSKKEKKEAEGCASDKKEAKGGCCAAKKKCHEEKTL